MASNYTGNPNATQAPGPVPGPGSVPIISIPAGTDTRTIESISQALKESVDYIAYIQSILKLGIPSTSSTVPQLRVVDPIGNGRYVIDHNGLPTGGRIRQHRENWETTSVTPSSGVISGSNYTAALGTASVVTVVDPTASYNSRSLKLAPSSAGTAETIVYGPALCIANTSYMTLVIEFEVGMNAALAGTASNVSLIYGLSSLTDPAADVSAISFYKKYNNVNHGTFTGNGSISAYGATTVAASTAAYPVDRLRIEIQGSASAYGAYKAFFYVNEALATTITSTNLPGGTLLRPMLSLYNENGVPSGSPLAYVGPITATWTAYASGPNL